MWVTELIVAVTAATNRACHVPRTQLGLHPTNDLGIEDHSSTKKRTHTSRQYVTKHCRARVVIT